jgi:hypothetical protein
MFPRLALRRNPWADCRDHISASRMENQRKRRRRRLPAPGQIPLIVRVIPTQGLKAPLLTVKSSLELKEVGS